MKRLSALVCCLLSCALAAQEGPSSAEAKLATIQGVVVKEPGSEPIKKALIELIAESQNGQGNYTALSGNDGSFRVENIVPGRYRLFVERTGYQEIIKQRERSEGRLITLAPEQELKDFVIHLQAAAVIEGRVTDEDGDPMAEAQIAVFRQTFVAGHTRWEQIAAERTNDLGEYRISGLAPGQYFVAVTPPPDFRSLIETAGNKPRGPAATAEKPANYAYQTTYYPGTRERAQATPIQLHPGDVFPANFSLTRGPSLTIKGAVTNLPAGASAAITLQSRDFNVVLNGTEMRKDGSFEIRDVSPGAYTIIATVDNVSPPMMARQSLQVAENIDDLRLSPQVGGTIRGRLRIEGGPGVRTQDSQIFLLLRPSEDAGDALSSLGLTSQPAQVNADGIFEWKDVAPDRYFIQLSDGIATTDWFVKSVATGGRDVSESGFNVGGGVTTLDLVASTNGASLEGVVTNAAGEPVADSVLVALPETRLRRLPDHYRKTASDQSGRFRLRGLPPGDYTIFAWESVEGEAYFNPGFIRSFEGQGKVVHVSEGQRVSLQVKVIPESDNE
jgi:hypothetical protein